jgi:hypothetical protein
MRLATSTALLFSLALVCAHAGDTERNVARQSGGPVVQLANEASSFKFVVLGDSGTGKKPQYELADQMVALRGRFDYGTVILLGNNIQGSERPQDFVNKFESPYRRLLDQGVAFRAVLGNDDSREQRRYKLFNMSGEYYTFSPAPGIQVFTLDSTLMTPTRVHWVEEQLQQSSSVWKIAVFHHSLYSSGRRHGSQAVLRSTLEPLFVKYNVSVVFSAHDNFYERITPQKGNLVLRRRLRRNGSARRHRSKQRTHGERFDTDLAFVAAEVGRDSMTFNAISRVGQTVDSGQVLRRK